MKRRAEETEAVSRILVPTLAFVVGLLALAILAWIVPTHLRGGTAEALDVLSDAPPFTLTDHLDRQVHSGDFRGKVVVANFIYTSCRDICPLLSARMALLQGRLRDEALLGRDVQLLSFSVDPERDTPAVLRAYADRYGADPAVWRFLTGGEEYIQPLIIDGFHLGVQALPPDTGRATVPHEPEHGQGAYDVMHSGRFVLIDRDWRIRAYYGENELDPDRVVAHIRRLLS
ncbi:MAG: hypothetical protein GEU73_17345 [Chloroflexi bacterium]|nr:hypothetical protein [Chloroflexota bacterium]